MGINLTKGQAINLSKSNPGLSEVMVALGWDPIEQKAFSGGGFLSKLFGGLTTTKIDVDIDASVFMLDGSGRNVQDFVYFGQLKSNCNSIRHSGDNRTGDGDGDDETIFVDLARIPSKVKKLVFVVNIYNCVQTRQEFGMIENSYIRLLDHKTGQELVRYDLKQEYSGKTAVVVAELEKIGSEWQFAAIGEGTRDRNLSELRDSVLSR